MGLVKIFAGGGGSCPSCPLVAPPLTTAALQKLFLGKGALGMR